MLIDVDTMEFLKAVMNVVISIIIAVKYLEWLVKYFSSYILN